MRYSVLGIRMNFLSFFGLADVGYVFDLRESIFQYFYLNVIVM